MARVYPPIADIAAQVIRDVQADRMIKTAETQVLRSTTRGVLPETELSANLRKLAHDCRQQSDDITVADLQEFLNHAR